MYQVIPGNDDRWLIIHVDVPDHAIAECATFDDAALLVAKANSSRECPFCGFTYEGSE